MFKRKARYRDAWFKADRNKAVSRSGLVSTSSVTTHKPHTQFLIIFFHDLVSTHFGGHLMPQLNQEQKVRGNSRLRRAEFEWWYLIVGFGPHRSPDYCNTPPGCKPKKGPSLSSPHKRRSFFMLPPPSSQDVARTRYVFFIDIEVGSASFDMTASAPDRCLQCLNV